MLQTESICKRYGTTEALDQVSLQLHPGEILGLLGPNGAGKTTLIHALLGLIEPDGGTVRVFGLDPLSHRARLARRINYASATVNLITNLKVIQNMRIYARLYGLGGQSPQIDRCLDLFEIGHLKNKRAGQLSSGEQMRLNLARSLLNDPELLLLDEPTSSLDPDMADKVRVILKQQQREQGMAMLYTSHNMAEIEAMCDRILFLHKGAVIVAGTPAEIRRRIGKETLEEVFIHLSRRDPDN